MKLYQIIGQHYGPKDSFTGTVGYVLFESVDELYEWFKSEPTFHGERLEFGIGEDEDKDLEIEVKLPDGHEEDKFTTAIMTYEECWKRFGGDLCEEIEDYLNYDDLYYGKTYYGFEEVGEIMQPEDIDLLKRFNIL